MRATFLGGVHAQLGCLFAVMLCMAVGFAFAADAPPPSAPDAKAAATPLKEECAAPAEESEEAWQNRWFIKWGLANVHARVQESENQVNQQLNKPFGILIPGWDKPKTFQDMSDNWGLYDVHLSLGRDINEKWAWYVNAGGILGKIKNKENYLFPLPLNVKVDFGRKLWFVSAGVDYYPWGKPVYKEDKTRCAVMNALRSSRPFFEAAVGFVNAFETATVRIKLQHIAPSLRVKQYLHHPTEYISPRIGVETPLGKNDSFILAAGYLFFDRHETDFDNVSIYMLHSHRF